jgi:hypothetical protein
MNKEPDPIKVNDPKKVQWGLSLEKYNLLKSKAGIRLDLGCGQKKQGPEWVGVDYRQLPGVDIVHDLEVFPWPLPSNCANTVAITHVIEHIKPWLFMQFMAEVHRVCQPETQVFISGPYGIGFHYVQDPTHCNPINEATYFYWDDKSVLWNVYKPPVFHVMSFERVAADIDTDYNTVLQVCKPASGKVCEHGR